MSLKTLRKPVLICGAGIGGLLLSHAFKKHSIPFRIFERDRTPDSRTQGYRFRVQPEGYTALRAILNDTLIKQLEEFAPHSPDGGDHPNQFWNAVTGENIEPFIPQPKGKRASDKLALADRRVTRAVLLQGIDVEFGKAFQQFRAHNDGVTATLADGTDVDGSLLVGADGATSAVRKQLMPNYKLLETNGRWTWGKTPLTKEVLDAMHPKARNGFQVIRDTSNANNPVSMVLETTIFAPDKSRLKSIPKELENLEDYIGWTLMANRSHFEMDDEELFQLNAERRAAETQRLTNDWSPEWRVIFEQQIPEASRMYDVTTSPPRIPEWDGQGMVTLLGDASHTMVATAAAGASTAMRDAQEIIEALLAHDGDVSKAIDAYEARMRKYAEEVIRTSDKRSQNMFGIKSLDQMAEEQLG